MSANLSSYGAIENEAASGNATNKKCSDAETTFNLMTLMTGSGMLCLPFALMNMGWMGVLAIVLLGFQFMYTFYLLAKSTDIYLAKCYSSKLGESAPCVDYVMLGKLAFGQYGSQVVFLFFASEMLLALVSFVINIAINLHDLLPAYSVTHYVYLSTCVTLVLSSLDMQAASFASAFGLCMTVFLLLALLISGYELHTAGDMSLLADRQYDVFNSAGVPLSVGLITFCYGGHAAFPSIYHSMASQRSVKRVLGYAGAGVIGLYATIAVVGYLYYAQYVQSPVTLNIGKDLGLHPLPSAPLLRLFATLGVVSNLQVTSPLVVFALRDVVSKSTLCLSSQHSGMIVTLCIPIVAMVCALGLSDDFSAVCGFIGSVTTTMNSAILPMVFFHAVHKGDYPMHVKGVHLLLLCSACICSTLGMRNELCTIFGIMCVEK
eukprot:gene33711-40785_t